MEFLKLYNNDNKHILYNMSWFNKNSVFDKSTGCFQEIDLFTMLENVRQFDYQEDFFYDDLHYILDYTKDTILYLIDNINKEIKREHKILPISQAKEFDKKTILWLSQKNGRNIKEKLKDNKIKTVKRYRNVDTYENRILKIFLKKIVLIDDARSKIQTDKYLITRIRQWLRSDDAKNINEYGSIVYNNILLHHPHYSKIFKSYKWLSRLDEKLEYYRKSYVKQIKTILKFDVLAQLQFLTLDVRVLPSNLNNEELKKFDIEIDKFLIDLNININLSDEKNEVISNFKFQSVREIASNFILKNNINKSQDRYLRISNSDEKLVYIDLFRLFPIAKLNTDIIEFPILLKQKIENKIVNANNTKIIDLNNEYYALPEILKTYDTNTLRYFLEDIRKYFPNKQLNYIIPDYVNVFEFSQVKKIINSYFYNNRSIPKSILTGMKYLLSGELNRGDTLISIQKDHNNNLFVTPMLVKYNEKLDYVSKGLYLEKHPTKQLLKENDVLEYLNKYFSSNTSVKLLNKFLQNGVKGIIRNKIALYYNNTAIYLDNLKEFKKVERIDEIKKIFKNKQLFKGQTIDIQSTNKENLINFEKLLIFEKQGLKLWDEHLPKLTMGNILMPEGYFGEFVLVDDNSTILENGHIEIEKHFSIPAGVNEIFFPLILDDEDIGYVAYISSNEFPLKNNIECKLDLTYNYEKETPYELKFLPLKDEIKSLKIQWRKERKKDYSDLPAPNFPPKKSWNDFISFPKKDGSGVSNLLEWLEETIIYFDRYLMWVNNGSYKEDTTNKLRKRLRFPVFTIWNNGHSLSEPDVSDHFRDVMLRGIDSSLSIINSENIPEGLNDELFLFLCCLHKDAPRIVGSRLLDAVKDKKLLRRYHKNIAFAISNAELEWQQKLLTEVIKLTRTTEKAHEILSVSFWRSKSLIHKLKLKELKGLILKLYELLNNMEIKNVNQYSLSIVTKYLELLLALLRSRESEDKNIQFILLPSNKITKNFIRIIDNLTKEIIEKKIKIKSRIELDIKKPDNFLETPDLLYALRVYLSGDTNAANKIQLIGVSDD